MQPYPLITVVGASGFVGRHLVKKLANAGYRLRVLSRDAVGAEFLKTAGTPGQIVAQYADITRPETLVGKFTGSWAVINLVSILHESGRQKFQAINVEGAKAVAEAARGAGAERFIQISALGVQGASDTKYGRTKQQGEDAVRSVFADATILRPSLIIGPEDRFFQRFASMSMIAPALPLIGGGHTKFQPVLVSDVADAILATLTQPETAGQTYELGGAEVMSFRQMLQTMLAVTRRSTRLVTLPVGIAKIMGRVASLLPNPALTVDQVKLLAHDNVLRGDTPGFAALGLAPASVTAALPGLLARYIKD